MKQLTAIILVLITGIFCMTADTLPVIGDPNSPANQHVSPYYIENSKKDTGSPNIVTGVLADYRGFDTLGETSVMFVAGLSTVMILRTATNDKKGKKTNKKGAKK